jgi:hypothetical protein
MVRDNEEAQVGDKSVGKEDHTIGQEGGVAAEAIGQPHAVSNNLLPGFAGMAESRRRWREGSKS